MNRAVSICKVVFYLALVCLTAVTVSSAQKRGVITAKSAPVRIFSNDDQRQRSSRRVESSSSIEKDAFRLINYERQKRGLATLIWNDRVAKIARQHSRDMAQQHYFSHRGKDGSMVSDRAARSGVSGMEIGENIVYFQGYDDPAKFAADSWMNSKDHKRNILDKEWRESGIGAKKAAINHRLRPRA